MDILDKKNWSESVYDFVKTDGLTLSFCFELQCSCLTEERYIFVEKCLYYCYLCFLLLFFSGFRKEWSILKCVCSIIYISACSVFISVFMYPRTRTNYITSFSVITTVLTSSLLSLQTQNTPRIITSTTSVFTITTEKACHYPSRVTVLCQIFPPKIHGAKALTKVNGGHCTKPRRFISRARVMG